MTSIPASPAVQLSAGLPLWYQFEQIVRARIHSQFYGMDGRMPTEEQFCEEFGISLSSVRQGLQALDESGAIIRKRRLGTFVNPSFFDRAELRLMGTAEAFFSHQASETTEVIEHGERDFPPAIAQQFAPISRGFYFHRVRRKAGAITSVVRNYVLLDIGKRIQLSDFHHAPMSKILRDRLKQRITKIDDTIEAGVATPDVAQSLQIHPLSPVLKVTGRIFGSHNRLLDVAEIFYNAERFKFFVESRIES